MARHDIEVEIPATAFSHSDIVVTVNANGKKLGVLTFSRGGSTGVQAAGA